MTEPIAEVISNGLEDYTTDQRGDVGSLVRVKAIDAVQVAWQYDLFDEMNGRALVSQICGLAVEKLDKVRFRAWGCLYTLWRVFEIGATPPLYVCRYLQNRFSNQPWQICRCC